MAQKVRLEGRKEQTGISWKKYLKQNYQLYLFLIPGLVFIFIFCILPMVGIVIAFEDYSLFAADNPFAAMFRSEWVGLKHFRNLLARQEFRTAFLNTISISLLKLLINFPVPIIFAILLNELKSQYFSKIVQLVAYLPHFLSWTIVSGMVVSIFSSTGMINHLIGSFGAEPVNFLMNAKFFRWLIVFSDGWKEFGWSSIVYLAAITGLDEECVEAARVDGANEIQKIWYIIIPGIMPTIVMMLILRVGKLMAAGFEQIFAMYNPTVYSTVDIIETYIYRIGLGDLNFSFGTAVGLFNSVIAFTLVVSSNFIMKKVTKQSIW